ncbi:MAG: PEP-CTERM sorting domain-containing protein [Pirellulales bacterium]
MDVRAVDDRDLATLFQFINKVAGDIDLNGVVDANDQTLFNATTLGSSGNWFNGDFNRDGVVNAADQALLTANMGTSYTLAGFLAQGTYTGGAIGSWAQILKSNNSAIDQDTNIVVARAGGATIAGPLVDTKLVYVDLGKNSDSLPADTLNLAASTKLELLEGMLIRPSGVVNGNATNVIKLGSENYPATLAVVNGGQLNGAVTIQGNLEYDTTASKTFDGTIVDFSATTKSSLRKVGSGTLTFAQPQTYTGTTTVAGGTLIVNVNNTAANGAVTVAGGGRLSGSGTIGGATTIASAGIVSPGVGVGNMTFANGLSIASGGIYGWQLGSPTVGVPGTDNDLITVSAGTLVLGSGRVVALDFGLMSGSAPASGNAFWNTSRSWKIIDVAGTAVNTGNTNFSAVTGSLGGTGSFSTRVVTSGGDLGDVFLDYKAASIWKGALGDAWTPAGSWTAAVPASATEAALFSNQGGANVNLAAAQTVNKVTFDSSTSFTIAGSNTLTLAGNTPKIATASTNTGTQTISTAINLPNGSSIVVDGGTLVLAGASILTTSSASGVTASVASGATLRLDGSGSPLSNNLLNHVPVANNGTFEIRDSSKRVGDISGTGTTNVVSAGAGLLTTSIRQNALSIGAGNTVTIVPNGISTSLTRVGSLTIAGGATPTGKFDLNDNDLVIDNATKAAGEATQTLVRQQLLSGSNEFAWNGQGITSSAAAAAAGVGTPLALGYMLNNDGSGNPLFFQDGVGAPLFGGQIVDANAVLIKYTYLGDANLDGIVDTVDFNLMKAGILGTAPYTSWAFGDFDYNGLIDTVDFNLFKAGFLGQGGSQATILSFDAQFAAIPEPGTWGLTAVGLGGAYFLRRRRLAQRV